LNTSTALEKKEKPTWTRVVAAYQTPRISTSIWQIINSFGPFFGLFVLAYLALDVSYLLTLALDALIAGFMIRIFIIQHDCGHGSFFKSKRANQITGNICGILTMTPYDFWRTSHAIHHAHNGDLDHRGTGDVYTMTLKEYQASTPWQRFTYRLYRNPLLIFLVGPVLMFTIMHRTPLSWRHARSRQGRLSLIRTDLALLAIFTVLVLLMGWKDLLLVYFPVIYLASSIGVWMFYIQHQFEDAYWSQPPDWDYAQAALQGSTYYRLPKILQWFSGNIGLHHIHHLSPRIPNYELQRCHDENLDFQNVVTITLWDSLKLVARNLSLWDEEQQKLISFREAHRLERLSQKI
jgi:omega-6 fatty acid desaturase (delta-12 desaturase)